MVALVSTGEGLGVAIDWGVGRYEPTGEYLRPVSEVVVGLSGVLAGKSVVDVGCGTGNAALMAAERGAVVTGVDPAARLLEVARERAAAEQVEVNFVAGDAASIPVADQSADLVLSVFGTIFAPDGEAAIAELVRVTAPGGIIRFTAWPPGGPLSAINKVAEQFMAEVIGKPAEAGTAAPGTTAPGTAVGAAGRVTGVAVPVIAVAAQPKPFAWFDVDVVRAAFAPYGFEVELARRGLEFSEVSPEAYLAKGAQHPMSVSAMSALAGHPDGKELEAELLLRLRAVITEVNEDPPAFKSTNDYVILTAQRA